MVADRTDLVLHLGPGGKVTHRLTHFDRDTFTMDTSPETPAVPSPLVFGIDGSGKASTLTIDGLNGLGQGYAAARCGLASKGRRGIAARPTRDMLAADDPRDATAMPRISGCCGRTQRPLLGNDRPAPAAAILSQRPPPPYREPGSARSSSSRRASRCSGGNRRPRSPAGDDRRDRAQSSASGDRCAFPACAW